MLSDHWPPSNLLGSGYFFDSVEIWVAPIRDKSMVNGPLYYSKECSPDQLNREIKITETHGKSRDIDVSLSRNPETKINNGRRDEREYSLRIKEWELTVTKDC